MLSLLEWIFSVPDSVPLSAVLELLAPAREELLVVAALLPFAQTSLRAAPATEVHLTDASDWGVAHVSTPGPPNLGLELRRHTVRRGAWARLLAPEKEWLQRQSRLPAREQLRDGEEPAPATPLWVSLAQALPFQLRSAQPYARDVHVNVGELSAACAAEAEAALSTPDSHVLEGTDSQVALGALVKGRAASP